ncbi:MAG: chromophore lyase CpcT/CpeT [Flavobacteriales bacterium]|nr:chromophore lyase CpcT/CpeT [Flavobacteriales bacterium]
MTMEGPYSSADQAATDTSYLNIELEMVRIWAKRKDGAWFYMEQAAAESKAKPYRQRVYRLTEVNDSTFRSETHTIRNGERYFAPIGTSTSSLSCTRIPSMDGGLHHHLASLQEHLSGGTNGRDCPNSRSGAAYATSEVTIRSDRMMSWDRGYDDAGKQVWGATKGGYLFLKKRKY